jgi:hypothetical protein
MVALIAPDVCRYAVNGQYGGHDVVNIIDMTIDTTGTINDRADSCFDQAGIIINEWDNSILELINTEYTAESVSWIDLDSAEGSVGVRTSTDSTTWSSPGRSVGQGAPGNVATRINKNTTATRGQRQGRMYLAGFAEGWSLAGEVNQVNSDVPSQVNPTLASFLADINQTEGGIAGQPYESHMVVVHTKSGLFDSHSEVTSLTIDLYTASQVRRIRR